MTVLSVATVLYACELDKENEAILREAIANQPDRDPADIADELWRYGELEVWKNAIEVDFNPESVNSVEY